MIEIDNLTVAAGNFVLGPVSLAVQSGHCAVLMGKTGSGKTTLLEAVCGLRKVQSGQVRLGGRDVTQCKPAARGIGYVPQDRVLFPHLTVRDHLAFALIVQRASRRRIAERVHQLAAMLELTKLLDRRPAGLSGGEAQRVSLGRALSAHPRILLLDEPLSALDEATRRDMCEVLTSLRRSAEVTTLHVTHDRAEAELLGDRVYVMENGALRRKGLS